MKKDIYKFIRHSIIFLVIFLITATSYFLVASFYSEIPLKVGVQWIKPFFDHKIKLGNNISEPKLILLGGSSVDFSLSATKMEKELGIPTINFGSTASLSDYIFHVVKEIAKEGDTVFIPLEYHYYYCQRKGLFEPVTLRERYILYYDKEYYNSLPLYDRLAAKFSGFRDLIRMMDESNWEYSEFEDLPASLTINGDEKNTEPSLKPPKVKEIDWPIEFYSSFESDFESGYCVQELSSFIDWSLENNIRVIASYPSLYDFKGAYYEGRYPKIFMLIEDFYNKKNVQVVGTPYDFLYPYEDFFNTGYHLHSEAREKHTDKVIELLRDPLSDMTEMRLE
jgi:hypothetical protein